MSHPDPAGHIPKHLWYLGVIEMGSDDTTSVLPASRPRAYKDLLALWKGADADILVLIAAKSEYVNLQ